MEAVRILQVVGRLDRGGAETMLMNLYRQIDRSRVQFDFVLHTGEECAYSAQVRDMGGKIYSVPAFRGSNFFTYRSAWKKLLKEHPEYKLLHSHVRSSAALYLGIAGRLGRTTIIHSHNTSSGSGISAVVKGMMQLPLRYQADYLFACGQKAGEWLYGTQRCTGKRFYLIPNAIELERFSYQEEVRSRIRNQLQAGDQLVLGHVGRLEEQKNHEFLLDIFKAVHRKRKASVLWLIGSGKLKGKLQQKVKDMGLEESVLFLGDREDVAALLQGMDCFVFPSLFEGLPVTLIEAQAAGLPVAASDRITAEVEVTTLLHRFSLESGSEVWSENVLKLTALGAVQRLRDRDTVVQSVRKAGYDIRESSAWLQQFYLDCMAADTKHKSD